MDILSFIIGLVKGKNQGEDALIEIDDGIDALNNERVGETPYTVTFLNWDGTELCQIPVYRGEDCPDPIEAELIDTPVKDHTAYYQYEFMGWSTSVDGIVSNNALKKVKGDRTLYAILSEQPLILSSGYCGRQEGVDEVYYKLYPDPSRDDGDSSLASQGFLILNIYGSGRMANYNIVNDVLDTPWHNLATVALLYKIVIDEGVTELSSYIGANYHKLEEVVLPSTIKRIPQKMLTMIDGYKGRPTIVNIPSKIYSIDYMAFHNVHNNFKFVFERSDGWEYVPPEYKDYVYERLPLPSDVLISDPDSISNFMLVDVDDDNDSSTSKVICNVHMYNEDAFYERQ